MGYFQVRYDSRVVNYDRRGFIRLVTDGKSNMCNRQWVVLGTDPDNCDLLAILLFK